MQLSAKQDRSWSIMILSLLGLSLFGLALLGFAVRPQLSELEQPEVVGRRVLEIPPLPETLDFANFWEQAGFYTAYEDKSYTIQRRPLWGEEILWLQERETWVLVPQKFGQPLDAGVLELSKFFLEQGWLIQIEPIAQGYQLGLWAPLPQGEEKVLAYSWSLKTLTPRNYGRYCQGHIPLMGTVFDPWALERGTPQLPVLAIIIDDWGYNTEAAEPLLGYPFPLTIAVLPHLVRSQEMAARAHDAGHEVVLHQPMEALDPKLELGPGGIQMGMTAEEVEARIRDNLRSLPLVAGMNNHMGSRVTADPVLMEQILGILKEEGLFFVDSYTTSATVAGSAARALGVAYGVNNLFIDNENEVPRIKEQIRKGMALAKRQGQAVIIGHVRPQTAAALWEMIPEFLDSEVQLVPVSNLVQ